MDYESCTLCPRECHVNRIAGETGFCGCPDTALVAKVMLHQWEEPVLSPAGRSGAVFFGGCTLRCAYCQNHAISATPTGTPTNSKQLREILENLIAQGAENIDLVTPTQFLPTILPALTPKLPVPVIYNCGGYERPETVRLLTDSVDIWLPDLKYGDDALALQLSRAKDYFSVATAAIKEMVQQAGEPVFQGNQMVRGVIVRHLILPGQVENSLRVLDWLGEYFAPGQILVSLMRQYTPMPEMSAPFDRKVTDEEYDAVLSWMLLNRLQGFTQDFSSATENYIPVF